MTTDRETGSGSGAFQWSFGKAEFDEGRWQLSVEGQFVELERKPLDVLQYLLRHAGEAVTKEELLSTVWAGRVVVEAVLTNAVGKLRRALGDETGAMIVTLPRVGYRLEGKVSRRAVAYIPPGSRLDVGDTVPRRGNWKLEEPLARRGDGEVWLARHAKTGQARVFKFSLDGLRLHGLKREVTVARLLEQALGQRREFVRLLDWDFEQAPYFIEFEHGGTGLDRWQDAGGQGIAALPLSTRLALFCDAADAVAEAHGVGVLHKDLKPANLLLEGEPGALQLRVADFGSSRLFEPGVLEDLGITGLGLTQTQALSPDSGTPLYLAPEVVAGQTPTVKSDVYALGVTLYQMIVGDFRRPLAPGWESDIDDPLLRQDIADAANGDPGGRLESSALLAARIRDLAGRRERRALEEAVRERVALGEKKLARVRARRPWVMATMLVLVSGLVGTGWLLQRIWASEHKAVEQRDIALALNRFVSDDILKAANPFEAGKGSMTMKEALERAAPKIEQRFAGQPEVAAPLHEVVAQAYYQQAEYAEAIAHFQSAATLYTRLEGAHSAKALLQKALTGEALARDGDVPQAQQVLKEVEAGIAHAPAVERPLLWIHHDRALAWSHFQSGEMVLAVKPLEHALGQLALLPEPNDELELAITQALAMARGMAGMPIDEVQALQRQAVQRIQATKGGMSMPLSLSMRYGALRLRLLMGEERSLEQDYRDIVAELTEVMGPRNESTLLAMHGLAHILFKQERWAECRAMAAKVRQGMVEQFGPGHAHSANIGNTQGLCLLGDGQIHEAHAKLAEVLQGIEGKEGKTLGMVRTAIQVNLGHVLAEEGAWDELSALINDIRTQGSMLLKANSEARAEVDLMEGRLALAKGDNARARTLLQNAIAVLAEKNPEQYWLIRVARRELAKLA